MKKLLILPIVITVLAAFLCGCSKGNAAESGAYACAEDFLAQYKAGSITQSNADAYFDTGRSKAASELLLADENLTSPTALRTAWGIDEAVLGNERLEEICAAVRTAREARISYSIERVRKSKLGASRAYVEATLKHPYVTPPSEAEANEAVLSAAGVSDYGELTERFLEKRNLTDEEKQAYDNEAFAREFAEYIITEHMPAALVTLMQNAEEKEEKLIFTVNYKNNKCKIKRIEVK